MKVYTPEAVAHIASLAFSMGVKCIERGELVALLCLAAGAEKTFMAVCEATIEFRNDPEKHTEDDKRLFRVSDRFASMLVAVAEGMAEKLPIPPPSLDKKDYV